MSRVSKQLCTLSVVFSFGLLSLGFFIRGTFSWTTEHFPPLVNTASRTDAGVAKSYSLAKADGRVELNAYDEPPPRLGKLLTARVSGKASVISFVIVSFRFRIIFAPKVSRYISKSVLNI
jgi:hypothetical protein